MLKFKNLNMINTICAKSEVKRKFFRDVSIHSLFNKSRTIGLYGTVYGSFHVRSPRQKPLQFLIFLKIGTLIDLSEKIRF